MKKLNVNRNQITKEDAMAFRKRWKMVNAFEESELRALSANEKLGQLAMLMAFAKELDWTEALEREASKVRNRWNKLRKAYHA
jgi:hypothetical protein